jgi:soluble lytic murein transglycosylase-like protein
MAEPSLACMELAAQRYGLNADLLRSIAQTESSLDPRAVGHNRNGSRDIGLMQINSAWLPVLARHGISEQDLFDPCTNALVGAWVLAGNVARLGPTWAAVGAYNARSPELQRAYILRVQRHLAAMRPSRPEARHPSGHSAAGRERQASRRPSMPSRPAPASHSSTTSTTPGELR